MTNFVNAGLPKNISEALCISSKERKIGEAKEALVGGLHHHRVQFDPSTVDIGLKDICGELYVTASVKIPVDKEFSLGVEYHSPGRFRAWVEGKTGKVCTRSNQSSISYDSDSLPYCLAMCFAWLSLEVLNKQGE